MSVKTKISATIIPVMLLGVVLINISFGLFFQNYVLTQEKIQIEQSQRNITTFLDERKAKYIGAVNDWAHWDDTFHFIAGQNPGYPAVNLADDTFENLDLNFMIFTSLDGSVVGKIFYDFDLGTFSEFPSGFQRSTNDIIQKFMHSGDQYGILQIGESFYFITSSDVTDSTKTAEHNGFLLIGRQINLQIVNSLEKITGCTLVSIEDASTPEEIDALTIESSVPVIKTEQNRDKNDIRISMTLLNPGLDAPAIEIVLSMKRALYSTGIRQVIIFAVLNTIGLLLLSTIIYLIVGKHLSSPITQLVGDMKFIDISGNHIAKIPERGNDEFTYLRKSINSMLGHIEVEQNKVVANEEKLKATLVSVGDGVISVDNAGLIQFLNPVAEHLTGWMLNEAINQPIDKIFCIINEYTRIPVESPVKKVFETKEIVELTNHTLLVSRDGTEHPIEDTAAPIRDMHGQTIGCVLVFRDFSERKEKQRRIEYLSYHDQLSGLYNRRFFEEELKRMDVKRNLPFSFIYSDVNGLKTINDAFGHHHGDRLIRDVSEAMKSECRADDIIARTGGDEFVILLPGTGTRSAEKIAERIRERVEQIKFMEIGISIAFGWSTKIIEDQDVWDVLKSAESMMYQKKILNAASKRNAVIRSILNALLVKSPRENAHSRRVSKICGEIGKAFDLSDHEAEELKTAGELHDIGKIAIDESVLNKEDHLSDSEWAQIKHHPETGYRLLSMSSEFYSISEYVLAHHEHWDGSGYPRGLSGEAIPWKARIIAVADSFDAMTSDRPYRKAMSHQDAVQELRKGAGTQFDPDIAKVFVEKVLCELW